MQGGKEREREAERAEEEEMMMMTMAAAAMPPGPGTAGDTKMDGGWRGGGGWMDASMGPKATRLPGKVMAEATTFPRS